MWLAMMLSGALAASGPAGAVELAPLDFLVGHCWRGTLANGAVDTHCFKPSDTGVRDHHEVASGGKTVYSGDTDYGWSDGAIRWTYRDATGGVMQGSVRAAPDGLDFGTADYVGSDGTRITIATHWVRLADTGYEVRDTSATDAHSSRTTRYLRVD